MISQMISRSVFAGMTLVGAMALAETTPSYIPGTAAQTLSVVSAQSTIGSGSVAAESADPLMMGNSANLKRVDHVAITTQSNLELYAGADLLLALSLQGDSATVIYSTIGDLQTQSIRFQAPASAQNSVSTLEFTFQQCASPAQSQVADKGSVDSKQGQPVVEPMPAQAQKESKEPIAVPQPKEKEQPSCQTAVSVLNLQAVQEKAQEKQQGKH